MALTQITEKGIKDGEIINADVNASAAIAGTKIAPDFGSQNITTTGEVLIGTSTSQGNANANDLVVATSGHSGLTIRSGTSSNGNIFFADGTSGSDEYRGVIDYKHNGNSMSFSTDAVERMRIDSSGNIGIGTTSPSSYNNLAENLVVATSSDTGITIATGTSSQGSLFFADGTSGSAMVEGFVAYEHGSNFLKFGTSNAERMRIDSSGRLAIGNTNPSSFDDYANTLVVGTTSGNHGITIAAGSTNHSSIYFADGTSSGAERNPGIVDYNHNTNKMRFATSASDAMVIDSSGNIGIGTTNPTSPDGSNADNPLNGPVLTVYGDSPAINLTSSTTGSDDYSLINFGRTGSSSNPYRAVIGYKQSDDILRINANNHIAFDAGGGINTSERMRIDGSGRVLIGTTTGDPYGNRYLTVNSNSGTTAIEVRSATNGDGRIIFTDSTSADSGAYKGQILYDQTNDYMSFNTNGSNERMRIDSSGRLLINRTSAFSTGTSGTESAKLQVGISGTSGTAVGFADTGGYDTNVMVLNHARAGANSGALSGVMIQFRNSSNNSVGGISSGASSTTYSTSSDYRLKEKEVLISDGITRLKQLKPYRFNFKVTPNITQDGFFAHEAQAVVPEAITGTKDGMKAETYYEKEDTLPSGKVVGDVKTYSSTEPEYQGIDQSKLVPLLTAALQEVVTRVEKLEAA